MQLDEFVSETIKALIKSINDTQEFAKSHNSRVNPIRYYPTEYRNTHADAVYFGKEEHARPLTNIEFDIAVTASNTTEKGAQGGITVLSFNIGGKKNDEISNQTVTRIKFELGVVLPHALD